MCTAFSVCTLKRLLQYLEQVDEGISLNYLISTLLRIPYPISTITVGLPFKAVKYTIIAG